ncbi:MAG: metal-dependent hydrolase [Nanoarchaeota archaeon]|jgi:membrane-bound metal-dependent hydrolase YbcI (DUF457 family)|nr:metal-dependent hydrolase [Nanoarchaeota archaeon]
MLGKDHIGISMAFMIPFLIPLLFLNIGDIVFVITIMASVFVGSLIPDSDCGGRATIYYKFPLVHKFMDKVVGKLIVFSFNNLISKKKISVEHKVGDEHRGIIHSPIGVLLTSIMISLPIIIVTLILRIFYWKIQLAIFLGLIAGQLLHLLEDSCTISGINWAFPFGNRPLKGKIHTFFKNPELRDIRPLFFAGIFHLLTILLVIGLATNFLSDLSLFILDLIIIGYEIIAIFAIIGISKTNESQWLVHRKIEQKVRKKFKEVFSS